MPPILTPIFPARDILVCPTLIISPFCFNKFKGNNWNPLNIVQIGSKRFERFNVFQTSSLVQRDQIQSCPMQRFNNSRFAGSKIQFYNSNKFSKNSKMGHNACGGTMCFYYHMCRLSHFKSIIFIFSLPKTSEGSLRFEV